jgi:hypothetical protein
MATSQSLLASTFGVAMPEAYSGEHLLRAYKILSGSTSERIYEATISVLND